VSDNVTFTDFDFEADRMHEMAAGQGHKLDAQLHVQFYKHAELDSFQTQAQGRKIFNEHVYIRILAPANRLNVIERRATDEDRARFRNQFVAFVRGGEQLATGTPLTELPTISAAQVLELKALKVDTIEQLAGMADTTAQLLGTGGVELKARATRYLDRAANAEELSAEVRELKVQLAKLLATQKAAALANPAPTVTVTTDTPEKKA
jgi:hypothetical protein